MDKQTFEHFQDRINKILAEMKQLVVEPLKDKNSRVDSSDWVKSVNEQGIICFENTLLELEDENFRVDSSDWKLVVNEQDIVLLENSEGDIWEYVNGVSKKLIGQQLFTWSAAMRETKKVGKRMPTDKEFDRFKKEDFGEIVYAGFRHDDTSFQDITLYMNLWSSSPSFLSDTDAWRYYLSSGCSFVFNCPVSQTYGFSVRCLKSQ